MPTDAVIVLANLMDAQGRLNPESAARAARAALLFHATGARMLVTSGWAYRNDSPVRIADAMRDHLVAGHGIPPDRVLSDTRSRDTVGDAYFTKVNLAKPRGWKSLVVVTSDYHAARTREIFAFVYGPSFSIRVEAAETPPSAATAAREQASVEAFRRTFQGIAAGDDDAILERMRERHPFYNGDVHGRI